MSTHFTRSPSDCACLQRMTVRRAMHFVTPTACLLWHRTINGPTPTHAIPALIPPLRVPAIHGTYRVSAISTTLRYQSLPTIETYYIRVATPGFWWNGTDMNECGSSRVFCEWCALHMRRHVERCARACRSWFVYRHDNSRLPAGILHTSFKPPAIPAIHDSAVRAPFFL